MEHSNSVSRSTAILEVVMQQRVLWEQILAYLSPDDIFFGVRAISTVARTSVPEYFQSLDSLHASFFRCRRVRPTCMGHVIRQYLHMGSPLVRHVDLSGLPHFTGRCNNISLFFTLFRKFRVLETLYVVDCPRVEARTLMEGFDPAIDLKSLKHLYLSGCVRVDSAAILNLEEHPTLQLETLHINGCSSRIGLGTRSLYLRQLRTLNSLHSLDISGLLHWFADVHMLTSRGDLREFQAQACRNFKFYHRFNKDLLNRIVGTGILQGIDSEPRDNLKRRLFSVRDEIIPAPQHHVLTKWKILNWNDPTFADSALCLIALQSCRLTQVHLRGCSAVRDEEIRILAVTCGDTLKVCELVGLDKLRDSALEAVGLFCHALVDLDVSACFDLTDRGIVAVSTGCQKLRCLRMDNLSKLTDAALQAITLHLNELLVLSAKGCVRLSRLDRLPPLLVELDVRETHISVPRDMLPQGLAFKNGRRQNADSVGLSVDRRCSFSRQAKRLQTPVKPQAMWSCWDCDLLPNRAICGACALHCHRGHRVQMVGLQRFYCDCALGLAPVACQCIKYINRTG